MKKFTCLVLAVAGLVLVAKAQITKGSVFLGGSVSFGSSNSQNTSPVIGSQTNESKARQFNLLPQFGIAVGTNKIAGLFLIYSNGSTEQATGISSVNRDEFSNVGGGIFYRRYYPLSQRFYLFGEAAAGIAFLDREATNRSGGTSYVSSDGKATTASLSLMPGITYAAGKKLFLEAALNDLLSFSYSSAEATYYNPNGTSYGGTKNKEFRAAANANGFSGISVGLRWILPRKTR